MKTNFWISYKKSLEKLISHFIDSGQHSQDPEKVEAYKDWVIQLPKKKYVAY